MKRVFCLVVPLLVLFPLLPGNAQSASADERETEPAIGEDRTRAASVVPFSVAFVPGLSMNARRPSPVKNYMSLNLLGDSSDLLSGVELSGLFAIRRYNVEGAQASGLVNVGLRDFNGLQGTGLVNYVGGGVGGLQLAGIGSWSSGDLVGGQSAGAANVAVGNLVGLQHAGGANVAVGAMTGLQMAAGANVAVGTVRGVQAATVNYAHDDVRGAQLGVVNIARRSTFSLGVLSIVREGRTHVDLWGNEAGFANVAVKHGDDYWHGIYSVGYQPGHGEEALAFGLGIGGHIPLSRWLFLDVDLITSWVKDREVNWEDVETNSLSTARLVLGVPLVSWLAIYAGASVNVLVTDHPNPDRYAPGAATNLHDGDNGEDPQVELWPGFVAGLQFL